MRSDAMRIISGPPEVMDKQVNELYAEYHPLSFSITEAAAGVSVTVVLVHRRELRAQAPALSLPGNGRGPFGA